MSYSETTLLTLCFREGIQGIKLKLTIKGEEQEITVDDLVKYDKKTDTFVIKTTDGDIIPIGGDILVKAEDTTIPSGSLPTGEPNKPRNGGLS